VVSNKLLTSLLKNPLKRNSYYFCYFAMSSQSGNAWAQMKAHEQNQQQQTANTSFDKGKQASSTSSTGVHECFSLKTVDLGANMLLLL
jgi:hypothetical protein